MDLGKTHISMISDGGRISIAYNMKRFEYKKLCSQNNPRVEVRISVKIQSDIRYKDRASKQRTHCQSDSFGLNLLVSGNLELLQQNSKVIKSLWKLHSQDNSPDNYRLMKSTRNYQKAVLITQGERVKNLTMGNKCAKRYQGWFQEMGSGRNLISWSLK